MSPRSVVVEHSQVQTRQSNIYEWVRGRLDAVFEPTTPLLFRVTAWAALSFAFGCAGYLVLPFEPSIGIWVVLCAVFLALALALSDRLINAPIALCIAVSALASIIGVGYTAAFASTINTVTINAPIERVMVEGWITNVLPRDGRGVRLELDVHAISGLDAAATPSRMRLTHMSQLGVKPGRFVRCYSSIRPPPKPTMAREFNFAQRAWFEQLGAVGFVFGSCRPGTLEPQTTFQAFKLNIAAKRRAIAERTAQLAGPSGGVAAALLSGDRSFIRDEHAQALRDTGLAHLLAISGLHMGLAAAIVYFGVVRSLVLIEPLALRVPIQKLAAFAAILSITAYLILTGASVSAQRAYVMAVVALTAIMFDRPAISMRSLVIAMVIVLVLAPHTVMSPGFQMSFAATAALIAAYEMWQSIDRTTAKGIGIKGMFGSLTLTSAVAGTATAPFAIFHFERIATLGFVANLVAMPVFTFLTAPIAGLVAISFLFGLEAYTLPVMGWTLTVILQIATAISADGQSVTRPAVEMPVATVLLFTLAISAVVIERVRGIVGAISASAAGLLFWINAPHDHVLILPNGEIVTSYSGEQTLHAFHRTTGLRPLQYNHLTANTCRADTCLVQLDETLQFSLLNREHRVCLYRRDQNEICFRNPGDDQRALKITFVGKETISRLVDLPSNRPWQR